MKAKSNEHCVIFFKFFLRPVTKLIFWTAAWHNRERPDRCLHVRYDIIEVKSVMRDYDNNYICQSRALSSSIIDRGVIELKHRRFKRKRFVSR